MNFTPLLGNVVQELLNTAIGRLLESHRPLLVDLKKLLRLPGGRRTQCGQHAQFRLQVW
ncbi:MAG: hypothetical protein V4772_19795 [Pseudomonadota bacterium]